MRLNALLYNNLILPKCIPFVNELQSYPHISMVNKSIYYIIIAGQYVLFKGSSTYRRHTTK